MNCTNCGAPLPQGVAICPNCGASNPYNIAEPATPYNPYGSPSQPQAGQNYPQAPGTPPSTAYGTPADPYGYQQANPNPYGQAGSPYPPYGATVPNQAAYGNPTPNQAPYGTPPAGYGYPQANQVGTAPGMPGSYGAFPPPQPPKRRSRVGLIIGIIILVVVLACGGSIAAIAIIGSKGTATTNTTSTPTPAATPTAAGVVPSSSQISPAAAAILTEGQTSSAVDSNYLPTKVTKNFTSKQTVYLTFHVDSKGSDGYIVVKWYLNGQLLTSDKLQHSAQNDHGYFSLPYNEVGQGAAAMYWGTKADLSDSQLALVVNFTVA